MVIDAIRRKLSDLGIDPLPTVDEITKKMNSLRTYFNAENNKLEQSKSSGKGVEDVYVSFSNN